MITDKELIETYGVGREQSMALFLFLAFMTVGDEYKTPIGNVVKVAEDTFRLIIDNKTINAVAEEFMDHTYEVRKDVFN